VTSLASATISGGGVEVAAGVTALFGAVLVAMIVTLALEEKLHIKKSLITGGFAVVTLLLGAVCGLLPTEHAGGHMPVYVPMIEWEVVVIILGSGLFVDVTSRSGLFTWVAIKLTKLSGGDPWWLLVYYGVMTVVFSAVLNNVTAMIIVGSLTGVSLKKLGREEQLLSFLLVQGLLTNIGGLLTLISSVPNIIVGQAAGISFVSFFLVAAPFVVVATTATIWLGCRLFGIRRLVAADDRRVALELVEGFDERDGLESMGFFWFSTAMFGAFIVAVASTSFTPYLRDLGMGFVVAAFAVVVLARYKASVDRFYKAVDWDLLGFFVGLFIVIGVMDDAQVLSAIGGGIGAMLDLGETVGAGLLLVSAAAFSSVTDNIPLAAMLAKILNGLGTSGDAALWWSVVFGANLGGNLTPIGSASTIVAVTVIHKNGIELSFARFVKLAAPFALAQIGLAVVYVLVFLG
jgi:Na+/H+ antiporter NhaD/arsenite permease-like protein